MASFVAHIIFFFQLSRPNTTELSLLKSDRLLDHRTPRRPQHRILRASLILSDMTTPSHEPIYQYIISRAAD